MAAKTVKEMAIDYYPKLWSIDRLVALVKAGRLSESEYAEITGFTYPETA